MNSLGDTIGKLFGKAQNDVLIIAPFIRTEALSRLINFIGKQVAIKIVTRWRPSDLVAGASDLGVFDLAQKRQIPLFLRNDLHAKLFIADSTCLVGSANITATGLGFRVPANFELLVEIPRTSPEIVDFEKILFNGAIQATKELQNQLQILIDDLDKSDTITSRITDQESTITALYPNWVPQTMNPEELYSVYLDDVSKLSRTAKIMKQELQPFGLPSGLTIKDFRAWIASSISQTPLVNMVDEHIKEHGAINETHLQKVLITIGVDTKKYSSHNVLQVLERWLTYFLSSDFETARDTIKLIRAKRL